MAIVYILTNPAFDGYIKIGKTSNLEQRLRSLDNTSVPLPFRCVFAVEVEDDASAERLMHQAFADYRPRKAREFFKINPQRAIAALKLTGGQDVTPRGDIAEDEEGVQALDKATRHARKIHSFLELGLKIGDQLNYVNNDKITATVISGRKILFEDEETSLSRSALNLLHREGYTWKTVNGWQYWAFEGETVSERLERILNDRQEINVDEEN